MTSSSSDGTRIARVSTSVLRLPTDTPEQDGTLDWDATTMVCAHIELANGVRGFGYSYTHASAARVIDTPLAGVIRDRDIGEREALWHEMVAEVRNIGAVGVAACAIAAVDAALWDACGTVQDASVASLLGAERSRVMVYGSGGFTNYDDQHLRAQVGGWAAEGIRAVKIKIGRDASRDLERVALVRETVGREVDVMVDANGGYDLDTAIASARRFRDESGVVWFEEPRPMWDVTGLRSVRDRSPDGLAIAAGEYIYGEDEARRLLDDGAVDVLQLDATRCLGLTGYDRCARMADARDVPVSAHCAPSLNATVSCARSNVIHMEWFFDHVRFEERAFGARPTLDAGDLVVDLDEPGLGVRLREADELRAHGIDVLEAHE